jgi:glycogen debranching enzyme
MKRSQHVQKERILTQPDPAKLRETHHGVVLKNGDVVLLTDRGGDVPFGLPHGYGLFFRDCRFLDGYRLHFDGRPATVLSTVGRRGFETEHFLTNPPWRRKDGEIPNNRIGIERRRLLEDGVVHERIAVRNFSGRDVRVRMELAFRARFEDLFIVKGFVKGPRGRLQPPKITDGRVVELRYHGRDGVTRRLIITFDRAADRLTGDRAMFDLAMAPDTTVEVTLTLTPHVDPDGGRDAPPGHGTTERGWSRTKHRLEDDEHAWEATCATLATDSALFDRVLTRGLSDLGILRSHADDLEFFAAGVPWYVTLFGRDSAIVALQTLAYRPAIARNTIRLLARYQARDTDAYRDAAPGKIVHEVRDGELAHLDVIPQSPAYYGTVDATMLFLILIAEYVAWSGDLALVRELRGHIDRALGWMDGPADSDGDGYLDYTGQYENGLVNQGWKDSGNAIVNADGSVADPPIALCEVQGYAYRAWRQTAALLRRLGDDTAADALAARAAQLRERFAGDYWSEALGTYVLARQRDGRPCEVVASNAGQVLWSGLAGDDHARRVAERLLRDDMFSGWGIRTLSRDARAYNPISYHLGSVWPHDNSLILTGFRRYGLADEAERVFDGVFEAATRFEHYRLPELFCGYSTGASDDRPIRYPVACSPQAWASGALPYGLSTLLGLQPDGLEQRLRIVQPRLPRGLGWLELRGVRVADARVDLRWERRPDGAIDVGWHVSDGRLDVDRVETRPPDEDARVEAGVPAASGRQAR